MATWAEIKGFLGDQFVLMQNDDKKVSMNFQFEDGRSQVVYVWRLAAPDGDEWLQIESPFGNVDQVNVVAVLRALENTIVGALGISDDILTLRHPSLLRTIDTDELLIPIRMIAVTADELESQLGQDVF